VRPLASGELADWLSGSTVKEIRVSARRAGGGFVDMSSTLGGDWVLAVQADSDTPDQPTSRFVVEFLKHATEASTAPGIGSSSFNSSGPLLHPGSVVEVYARVAGRFWHRWLEGNVEDVEWGRDRVVATCLTKDAHVFASLIHDRTSLTAGTVENLIGYTAMQYAGVDTYTIGSPSGTVPAHEQQIGSAGARNLELAQAIGWDVRYRWHEPSGEFQYTLYEPPRSATTPAMVLGPDVVIEPQEVKQSREGLRNVIYVDYAYDEATKTWARQTAAASAANRAQYGDRRVVLQEGSDSPVQTSGQAAALAAYALSDLSRPLIDGAYRIPFMPLVELHDVVEILADGDTFDSTQAYAVVGAQHRIDAESSHTVLQLRGGAPVGSFYAWRRRFAPPAVGGSPSAFVDLRQHFWPLVSGGHGLIASVKYNAFVGSLVFSYADASDPSPEATISGTYTKNVASGGGTREERIEVHGGGSNQVWPDPATPPRPNVNVTVSAYSGSGGGGILLGSDTLVAYYPVQE
jgi:hypothetical protein